VDETGAKAEEPETGGGRCRVGEADIRRTWTRPGVHDPRGRGRSGGLLLRGVVRMVRNWVAWVGG
jgi:hypothetical protein